MDNNAVIWVLLDDKMGHQNQSLGIADALKRPYIRKQITYNLLARLPNFLKYPRFGLGLLGVNTKKSDVFEPPWPDLVIACGRKTAPIAHYIKQKSGNKTKIVHVMWPCYRPAVFDLIALPEHDGKHGARGLQTTFPTLGAPHRITKEALQIAHAKWAETFKNHNAGSIAVFVGGDSAKISWKANHMQQFIGYLRKMIAELSGTIYITTSRRTPLAMIKALRVLDQLHENVELYIWEENTPNPYHAMLAKADGFVLTGDSINMITESCYRGRPVCAHMPWDLLPKKHQRFLHAMIEEKYLMPLEDNTIDQWLRMVQQQRTVPALPNPAIVIAEEIEENILIPFLEPQKKKL